MKAAANAIRKPFVFILPSFDALIVRAGWKIVKSGALAGWLHRHIVNQPRAANPRRDQQTRRVLRCRVELCE